MSNSFDEFTIKLVGIQFNGEAKVIDESGGEFGRLCQRVHVLEGGYKAMTRTMVAVGLLLVLNGGITNARTILEFFEKILRLVGQ